MAEWLVEQGIGEERAVLVEGGEILAAKIDWPGSLASGLVEDAVLISRTSASSRGTARFSNGELALVDSLPRDASEGKALRLLVTRPAIFENSRAKLAQARPTTDEPRLAPRLAEVLDARLVRHFDGWDELWADAYSGTYEFAGGQLQFTVCPAFTAIDIDGHLPARELALAAVPALAQSIRQFNLGGSVVIDFPTLSAKADRQAVDSALAEALASWPHERTAMNGFGLVQLVARLERPSLLDCMMRWPDAAVRLLLRRAEQVTEPGSLLLTAHPRIKAAMWSEWESELARRTGRLIAWKLDETLAPNAAFAQAVPL